MSTIFQKLFFKCKKMMREYVFLKFVECQLCKIASKMQNCLKINTNTLKIVAKDLKTEKNVVFNK